MSEEFSFNELINTKLKHITLDGIQIEALE